MTEKPFWKKWGLITISTCFFLGSIIVAINECPTEALASPHLDMAGRWELPTKDMKTAIHFKKSKTEKITATLYLSTNQTILGSSMRGTVRESSCGTLINLTSKWILKYEESCRIKLYLMACGKLTKNKYLSKGTIVMMDIQCINKEKSDMAVDTVYGPWIRSKK